MSQSFEMQRYDRFDDLIESLAGFHRTWLIALGLDLGLLALIREAGAAGIEPAALATAAGCAPEAIDAWTIAAFAHDLIDYDGSRMRLDEPTAMVLLDEERPEYLGGQFTHAVIASLDHGAMADVFRTGDPVLDRPDRYRASIERLTRQDIAVFFEEALAAHPDLVADLAAGGRVVDLHCGGGRWLIAMAQRFRALDLLGVEFEPDSVARATRNVAEAGLADRITIVEAGLGDVDRSVGRFDLAYFQYALHALPEPDDAIRAAWSALRPGGRFLALEWCAPIGLEDYRTQHGRLVSGIQLDELFGGSRLQTVDEIVAALEAGGLPGVTVEDLPSGATLFMARKEGDTA
jgi:SAM-dependent methyltransferase